MEIPKKKYVPPFNMESMYDPDTVRRIREGIQVRQNATVGLKSELAFKGAIPGDNKPVPSTRS